MSFQRNQIKFAGFLLMAIYLAFCVIYFRERICFADTAHMLVKIINSKSFNIEAGRYPQIFTQLLTIASIRLHLSTNVVMVIYSISFPLLYALLAWIALKKYQFKFAFPLLIFSLTGAVHIGFYHAGTETHQSIAWAVLFLAWLFSPSADGKSRTNKTLHVVQGLVICMLTLHSHPVGLFLLLFSCCLFWVETRDLKRLEPYIAIALIVILSIVKILNTDSDSYEGQFFSQIPQFPNLIAHLSENWSLDYFWKGMSKTYLLISVLFSFGLLWMLRSKAYLRAGFYAISTLGFLLFTVLIYHTGDSELMMDRAFMPLAFFIAAPLCFQWNIESKGISQFLQLAGFSLVFYFAFAGINNKGNFMRSRLAYMSELHHQYKASRVYLHNYEVDMNRVLIPWSYSLETLLYSSSTKGADNCYSIIVTDEYGFSRSEYANPDVFMSNESYGRINFDDLNADFFQIGKSVFISNAYFKVSDND
jgi:hypothetical protein